ncbi:hypothetical protein B0H16DRAFT_1469504 [Mycena metata]|uniref:Uncharacterized protein n=1 Tax=Mycena metata TaxID=1033252 RepID=A0AAD7HX99_9AGAR|nr:hypothetical protein B0H16DRAFT_1469504 [Mycena metata]
MLRGAGTHLLLPVRWGKVETPVDSLALTAGPNSPGKNGSHGLTMVDVDSPWLILIADRSIIHRTHRGGEKQDLKLKKIRSHQHSKNTSVHNGPDLLKRGQRWIQPGVIPNSEVQSDWQISPFVCLGAPYVVVDARRFDFLNSAVRLFQWTYHHHNGEGSPHGGGVRDGSRMAVNSGTNAEILCKKEKLDAAIPPSDARYRRVTRRYAAVGWVGRGVVEE